MMPEQARTTGSDVSAGRSLLELYVAPRSAFRAFAARPRAAWLAVALLALCNGAFTALWLYKTDLGAIQRQSLEARGIWDRLAPDERRDVLSRGEQDRPKVVAIGTLGPVLLVLGATAVYALVFRLALARPVPVRSALAVVAPANFAVDAVRLLLVACAMALSNHWSQTPDAVLMSNPAALLDPSQRFDPGPLFAALQSVDLFTLWLLGLIAVGFGVMTREPLRVTGTVVGVLWVVYVAVKLLAVLAMRGML